MDIEAKLEGGKYTNSGDVIAAGLQVVSEKEIEAAAVAKAEAPFTRYQARASARPWSGVKPDMNTLHKKMLLEVEQRGRT